MIPARRYAREIESRWATLLERPVVLGERDWSVICDWHARAIPLSLIGEAFDHFAETLRKRRGKPRNLNALVPYVEDAWRTVRGGRFESEETPSKPVDPEEGAVAAWQRCASALGQDDPLGLWVGGLLDRVASGEPLERVEQALAEGLLAHLDADIRAELQRAVEAELEAFRGRMTRETWAATRERGLISAARRRFRLPVLSGPRPSPRSDETF